MSTLFLIVITTCLNIAATAQVSNATFEKKIVVTTKSIRIDSLLKVFARQTGVEFSFNTSKISPSKTLPVSRPTQTLSQWLTTLRQNLGIQHTVVGNHIILVDKKVAAIPQKSKAAPKAAQTTPAKKTGASTPSPQTTIVIITDSSQHEQRDTVVHQPVVKQASSPGSITNPPQSNTPNSSPSPAVKQQSTSVAPPQKTTAAAVPEERKDNEYKTESIQALAGYSKHGSGDLGGIVFGAEYTHYLSNNFSLNYMLRGTINNGNDIYVRYTTAGAQLGANAQLSVVRSIRHEVMISLGAFGRYQSASNGDDGYSVYLPWQTGIPVELIELYKHTPQNTISAGYLLQFKYHFTLKNNIFLGVVGGLQNDTNADLIGQAGLTVGKRL